jgi:hypothetical protein
MQKDQDFGTNVDGTKNNEYCGFCYKHGGFTDEGISMERKIDKIVKIAVSSMNIPETKARAQANSIIPRLKRWRKAE